MPLQIHFTRAFKKCNWKHSANSKLWAESMATTHSGEAVNSTRISAYLRGFAGTWCHLYGCGNWRYCTAPPVPPTNPASTRPTLQRGAVTATRPRGIRSGHRPSPSPPSAGQASISVGRRHCRPRPLHGGRHYRTQEPVRGVPAAPISSFGRWNAKPPSDWPPPPRPVLPPVRDLRRRLLRGCSNFDCRISTRVKSPRPQATLYGSGSLAAPSIVQMLPPEWLTPSLGRVGVKPPHARPQRRPEGHGAICPCPTPSPVRLNAVWTMSGAFIIIRICMRSRTPPREYRFGKRPRNYSAIPIVLPQRGGNSLSISQCPGGPRVQPIDEFPSIVLLHQRRMPTMLRTCDSLGGLQPPRPSRASYRFGNLQNPPGRRTVLPRAGPAWCRPLVEPRRNTPIHHPRHRDMVAPTLRRPWEFSPLDHRRLLRITSTGLRPTNWETRISNGLPAGSSRPNPRCSSAQGSVDDKP